MFNFSFIDASHANITALLAIPLAVFTFFVTIGSLLILRQAHQMTSVLPTPLSPVVRLLVAAYAIASIFILAIMLITVFS